MAIICSRMCEGLTKMLDEHIDFDIANFSVDFSEYELLIFPSGSVLSKNEILKVKSFIKMGFCANIS